MATKTAIDTQKPPAEDTPVKWAKQLEDFRRMPLDDLLQRLTERFRLTVEHIVECALIVKAIEEKGADITTLDVTVIAPDVLREIAAEALRPGLAFQYIHRRNLLRKFVGLSADAQKQIERDDPIGVVVYNGEGQPDLKMTPPSKLASDEWKQVLADDHIRDESEQRGYMPVARRRTAEAAFVDRRRKELVVNAPARFSKHQVSEFMRQMR